MLPIGAPNGVLLLSEIRIMDLDLDECVCVCVHGVWVVGVVGLVWCVVWRGNGVGTGIEEYYITIHHHGRKTNIKQYSIVRKRHKIEPEKANGDCLVTHNNLP